MWAQWVVVWHPTLVPGIMHQICLEAFSDGLRRSVWLWHWCLYHRTRRGIKTGLGLHHKRQLAESAKGGAYEVAVTKAAEGMRKQYLAIRMSNPKVISNAIQKQSTAIALKTRCLVGMGANLGILACYLARSLVWCPWAKRTWEKGETLCVWISVSSIGQFKLIGLDLNMTWN